MILTHNILYIYKIHIIVSIQTSLLLSDIYLQGINLQGETTSDKKLLKSEKTDLI